MADEAHLIDKITAAVPSLIGSFDDRHAANNCGIGDDSAVLRARSGRDLVVTVDSFIEDVHFWAERHPADSVGYKALARATSDLAAMGATPSVFFLALALPPARTGTWLDGFLAGMGRAARSLGLKLVGGDTTKSAIISAAITVLGDIRRGRAVMRSGAKPGDGIYVSGTLGGASLGLELVRLGLVRDKRLQPLLAAHLYPQVRLKLGNWLAENRVASSMMDISDGLSSDLARLCAASRVGACLYSERIPRVNVPLRLAKRLGSACDPLALALHGGDDYELLFTVPRRLVVKLKGAPEFRELRAIGEIVRGRGISLVEEDGRRRPLKALGWDSFREK
jgi:thiamine-monophosphate kinase